MKINLSKNGGVAAYCDKEKWGLRKNTSEVDANDGSMASNVNAKGTPYGKSVKKTELEDDYPSIVKVQPKSTADEGEKKDVPNRVIAIQPSFDGKAWVMERFLRGRWSVSRPKGEPVVLKGYQKRILKAV